MNLEKRIKLVKDKEFYWDWDGSNPTFSSKTPNSQWGGTAKFDPFPCYTHDKKLVIETVQKVEKFFPIKFDVFYFIYPHESLSRTNGQASTNTVTYADKEKGTKNTWDGVIELYGKRIPPHPAMTRYLCAHEYGHLVDTWICHQRGLEFNGMDKEYAKMRGIRPNSNYGGRKWHTNIGEIIANDFRIAVCDIESEFWPHKVKHPKKCPQVSKFWEKMIRDFAYE